MAARFDPRDRDRIAERIGGRYRARRRRVEGPRCVLRYLSFANRGEVLTTAPSAREVHERIDAGGLGGKIVLLSLQAFPGVPTANSIRLA